MKSIIRPIFMVFLVLVLLTMLAQGHVVAAEKKVLKVGVGVDVTTLDPANRKGIFDLFITTLIYEDLVTYDRNMKLVPALATSWEPVDDTTWRFKLRKGVKFHDGTPFDAEAAKINLDRVRDAPRSKYLYAMIESVSIEDDYTIVVKTDRPFAFFLNSLAHGAAGIISPKAIEEYGKEVGSHPAGTGRFKLKEWIPKERLVLVKNDEYWGKKAKLDEFVMRPIPEEGTRAMAFESGAIDVICDPLPHRIPEFKANKDIHVITGPETRVVWVGFNVGDKVLSNVKLRQAIGHAINRDEIIEYVVEGMALDAQAWTPGIVHKFKKKYNFDYDPKKAKELLREAGYPNGLELNFWTPEGRYLKDRQIAEAVQAQLAQIGIKAKLRVMEWGAYLDSCIRHEQQLFIMGQGFAAGAAAAMRSAFHSKSRFNFTNYKNPEFERILDRLVSTFDPKVRARLYEEAHELMMDEAFAVPIYHKLGMYAASKKVKNFYSHPMERIDISKTTVK